MRALIAVAVAAPLCGCGWLEDDVARTHDRSRSFDTASAYMTADARIVTQRVHPVTGQRVLCVEPSPDAIKAISNSGAVGVKGGNGAVTGGIDLSGTSGEAAAELAGRSTALLGLREGVFRACEAYSNGILGADAYGLILAKYAPTMTTLFLAQDITGAAGVARAALAANSSAPGGAGAAPATPPPGDKKVTKPAAQAAAASFPRIWPAAMVIEAAAKDSVPKRAAGKPDGTPKRTDPAPTTDPTATAALSLVRMNEDYMMQPQSIITTLIVACIEQNDPSRLPVLSSDNPPQRLQNQFLKALCADLGSIDDIAKYAEKFAVMENEMRLVEPGTPSNAQPAKRSR